MTITIITINDKIHKVYLNSLDAITYFNKYIKEHNVLEIHQSENYAKFTDGSIIKIQSYIPE